MLLRKVAFVFTLTAIIALSSACTIAPIALPTETPVETTPIATEEGQPTVPTQAPSSAATATDYCVEQGGMIVSRRAVYGIEGDAGAWVALHAIRDFCEFVAADGSSQISLDVETLWSTAPTLATLAYYQPPPQATRGEKVSASSYCSKLGGTSLFQGVTGKLGSWAAEGDDGDVASEVQLLAHCLFPDNSTIDAEGLFAHAAGTLMGIDLRTVFHYRPAQLPMIYPDGQPYETTAPGVPALEVMPNAVPEANTDAAAYCEEQGDQVILRTYFYGTNNDRKDWLQLATPLHFCEFDAQEGSSADPGSRISIDLETLYSEEPTLAAMAYINKIPLGEIPSGINPASVYCSQIGGTSIPTGSQNVAGGGWVNEDEPVFTAMDECVFADGSMIDQWGITYHTTGAIRGADLSEILRYSPD